MVEIMKSVITQRFRFLLDKRLRSTISQRQFVSISYLKMFVAEALLLLTAIGTTYLGSLQCAFCYGYFTKLIDSVSTKTAETFKKLKYTEGAGNLVLLLFFYGCIPHTWVFIQIYTAISSVYASAFNALVITNHQRFGVLFIKGVSHLISILAVVVWMTCDSSIVTDFLSCASFVHFVASVRIQSLRSGAVVLALLFAFGASGALLGSLSASKSEDIPFVNPLLALAQYMSWALPASIPVRLIFPLKLVFWDVFAGHKMVLGAVDMIVPGVFVAYALRCDVDLNRQFEAQSSAQGSAQGGVDPEDGLCTCIVPATVVKTDTPLFKHAMGGYVVGLVCFVVVDRICGEQWAVLYVVPCVVGALVAKAWHMDRFKDVWLGAVKARPSD